MVEMIDSRQEFDYLLSVKLEKSMDSTAKAKCCFNEPHANSMIWSAWNYSVGVHTYW